MTTAQWPPISVIIPTYNAGLHLEKLLNSLQTQTIPWDKLEIIVVDDDSEDDTKEIAQRFGAVIVRNGHRHIERGKAIGLLAASHEYVLFLDADNYLTTPDWVQTALEPLVTDETLVGAQSIRFHYDPKDPPANRYCSLFGINDPLAYYLGRRDRLIWYEKTWQLMGKVEDRGAYYIGTFHFPDVPTLGSQGFLTRSSLLKKVKHDPYLFHLEANLELIKQGYNRYVLLKTDVGHDHVSTVKDFVKKCQRNIELFYRWGYLRTYRWETPKVKLFFTVLSMLTVVRPVWDAWRGFRKNRDWAWFIHPWVSFVIPWIYTCVTLSRQWQQRHESK
ncbi:glycosyltransferase [bacterium]|nr:glycosyltransferase [bacterium]